MSNIVRSRGRRPSRMAAKEKAEQLEKALAASDQALGETQAGIDEALQQLYDAADTLENLLPAEEDPAAEERERELREKLDVLCATAVAEAATGVPPEGGSVAERLDEVMEAFEALPAMKWPEGPIGEELPEWMLDAIQYGAQQAFAQGGTMTSLDDIRDSIVARLSQKGDETPGPEPVENTQAAEA